MQVKKQAEHRGIQVPTFFYGTAWKEEQTEVLTRLALRSGFLAIDTANQRRHYYEAAVGAAVQSAIQDKLITREQLFLQTKFTYQSSQDHRLPYDPKASFSTQVQQSFESSLQHFQTNYLDSFLLHGPSTSRGLSSIDWEVWRAMEKLYESGRVRLIGVSNVNRAQLELLLQQAKIKPAFVQNRCYAAMGWDASVRKLCEQTGVLYQGFSLLTANSRELASKKVQKIVQATQKTLSQVVFRFALQVGMLPLTGTSSEEHMKQDLSVYDFSLSEEDVKTIEQIATL